MKTVILGLVVSCVLAWHASCAVAAEPRPVVVCSITNYDEFLADLDFLGALAQNPNFTKAVAKALTKSTQVQSVEGLDRRRPGGAVLLTDGLQLTPVAFVPTTDAAALLQSLAPLIGEAQPQPDRPRMWKIGQGATTGYLLERDGWSYLAQSPDALAVLPDPLATLGSLPATYDVAVQFFPTRLPEGLRTLGIDMLREPASTLPRGRQENATAYALRSAIAGHSARLVERSLAEHQRVTWGWSFDRAAKLARLEVTVLPEPGSRLARDLAGWKPVDGVKTPRDAALESRAALVLSGPQIQRFQASVASFQSAAPRLMAGADLLSESEREVVANVTSTLVRLWQPALDQGLVEVSLCIHGQAPPLTVVAAARIGDTSAVRAALAQLGQNGPPAAASVRVEIDAARLGDLRVHIIEFAGLAEVDAFQQLMGREATLFIAESGDTVLLALGNRALPMLEASLTTPATKQAPLGLSLKLGAAATVLATMLGDQPAAPIVSLVGANLRVGDDRLTVSADNDGRSLRIRCEVREGVLRTASLGLSLWAIQTLSKK